MQGTMLRAVTSVLVFFLGISGTAAGQNPQGAQAPPSKKLSYEELLEQVKKQDPLVDYAALRMAYTATFSYEPYADLSQKRESMFKALKDKNYSVAIEIADGILKTDYVDIDAHYIEHSAYTALGNQRLADFHGDVAGGLIDSILKSGDGLGPATAYTVICVREEYLVLSVKGLKAGSQELVHDKGHSYDLLNAEDESSGERVRFYFNIDLPMASLGAKMGKRTS
ncbi:MAG TPA: DUF4919 domain-containing protein [Blastocatellia bacterium]|nr:DUF4919 domain-containing protein [Blastocatellia bacterium]